MSSSNHDKHTPVVKTENTESSVSIGNSNNLVLKSVEKIKAEETCSDDVTNITGETIVPTSKSNNQSKARTVPIMEDIDLESLAKLSISDPVNIPAKGSSPLNDSSNIFVKTEVPDSVVANKMKKNPDSNDNSGSSTNRAASTKLQVQIKKEESISILSITEACEPFPEKHKADTEIKTAEKQSENIDCSKIEPQKSEAEDLSELLSNIKLEPEETTVLLAEEDVLVGPEASKATGAIVQKVVVGVAAVAAASVVSYSKKSERVRDTCAATVVDDVMLESRVDDSLLETLLNEPEITVISDPEISQAPIPQYDSDRIQEPLLPDLFGPLPFNPDFGRTPVRRNFAIREIPPPVLQQAYYSEHVSSSVAFPINTPYQFQPVAAVPYLEQTLNFQQYPPSTTSSAVASKATRPEKQKSSEKKPPSIQHQPKDNDDLNIGKAHTNFEIKYPDLKLHDTDRHQTEPQCIDEQVDDEPRCQLLSFLSHKVNILSSEEEEGDEDDDEDLLSLDKIGDSKENHQSPLQGEYAYSEENKSRVISKKYFTFEKHSEVEAKEKEELHRTTQSTELHWDHSIVDEALFNFDEGGFNEEASLDFFSQLNFEPLTTSSNTSPSSSNLSSQSPDNKDTVDDAFFDKYLNFSFNPLPIPETPQHFMTLIKQPDVVAPHFETRGLQTPYYYKENQASDPRLDKVDKGVASTNNQNQVFNFVQCIPKISAVSDNTPPKIIKHRIAKPSQIECLVCKKPVLRKNIASHRRTHYEKRVKKHICNYCENPYHYLKDLKRHKALKHGEIV